MGALVLLLGTAFIALLVEPIAAAAPEVPRVASGMRQELPGHDLVPPWDDQLRASEAARTPGPSASTAILEGARVRVTRLGIDLPLLPGDNARDTVLQATPNGAAFVLPASAWPGTGGNSYIYAHARVGMFLSLWRVRLGDEVEIRMARGEVRRYVVTQIHPRVVPTDFSHTLPTPDERLTLQTSTGPRSTDPRFVVVAARSD